MDKGKETEMSGGKRSHKIGVVSLASGFLAELFYSYYEGAYEQFKVQSPELDVRRIRLESKTTVSEAERESIRGVDVLVTDPFIFDNEEFFDQLEHVQWIQMFTAGVENVTRHYNGKAPPNFLLTRNAGFFDHQMAQYVVAQVLYRERLFQDFQTFQKQRVWKKLDNRPLDEITVGIVGYGSVGRKIAEAVSCFEMKVVGLVRDESKKNDRIQDGAGVDLTTDVAHLLRSSDYVVSVLPNTSSTCGFFDGQVLEHCKHKRSVFINIGRGNAVRNDTIIKALNEGWLSHAILDVFEKEPLPADSPLWSRDDVTITPHISGSLFDPKKFVKKTLENYKQFCDGCLTDVVDWSKGY